MIRKPVVAGTFYPSDRESLEELVSSFISGSGRPVDDFITGIISPHAGYVYSGAVAGAAFASAPDDVLNVIIIAPPHRYPVRGASIYDGEGYSTPLGTALVQREITSRLLQAGLSFQPAAHRSEHSAEVQIPFVQVRWPGSSIAVILQGSASADYSKQLAEMISEAARGFDNTLIIASSDLSHYHSLDTAEKKDRKIIEAFISGNTRNMEIAIQEGAEACGIGPILTLMNYAVIMEQNRFGEIMWETSAAASGDSSSVVGYFAGYCGREVGI
ncbi:MAG: AmmeMemoRadiSam system protein B [Candidatus Aegiribacteria sp.]|nr:AmmeMemoRadiSam system protein B [Candidatus Aegiribacteria sp.]